MTDNPKKKRRRRCEECGKLKDAATVRWSANPFQSEVNSDETPRWICNQCYAEWAGAI